MLSGLSYIQLLRFSNNPLPPGTPEAQIIYLEKLQDLFQNWTEETLTSYANIFSTTPQHQGRQTLLQLEPSIPLDLVHIVLDFLKMSATELVTLRNWFAELDSTALHRLRKILLLEASEVIDIQNRLQSQPFPQVPGPVEPIGLNLSPSRFGVPSPPMLGSDFNPDLPGFTSEFGMPAPVFEERVAPWAPAMQTTMLPEPSNSVLQLSINRQPPNKTVYQRILKPFPVVM